MDWLLKGVLVLGLKAIILSYYPLMVSFAVGFATGAFLIWRRRKSSAPPGYEELDSNITYLEGELKMIGIAVSKLLVKAEFSPLERNSSRARNKAYAKPDTGWGASLRNLLKRLSQRFAGGGEGAESDERIHPLTSRIQEAKMELTSLREDINRAGPFLIRAPPSGIRDEGKQAGVPPSSLPVEKNDRQEGGYSELFKPGDAGAQSGLDTPDAGAYWSTDAAPAERRERQTTKNIASDSDVAAEVVESYNRAVIDTSLRQDFRERYQPIIFGTVNAVERRQNPTLDAEFREATHGDFFAFAIPGENRYAVVPRFGLTIQAVSYNAGAVGKVFGEPSYDPALCYSRYRVRRAAIFKRDGDRWELRSPGDLELGAGD